MIFNFDNNDNNSNDNFGGRDVNHRKNRVHSCDADRHNSIFIFDFKKK